MSEAGFFFRSEAAGPTGNQYETAVLTTGSIFHIVFSKILPSEGQWQKGDVEMRTRVNSVVLLIAVMGSLLFTLHCYSATYYKYVDKNGTVCFTDSRQSIPEEYKRKATKITDEKENADKKSRDNQIKGDNEGGSLTDKKQGLSSEEKIKDTLTTIRNADSFRPAVAIAIFLFLFIAAGKIGRSLGHKQLSSVLRIALTVGILFFLFHTHVKKITDIFNSLKKDATDIAKRTEERNKKADDAAKDLLEPGSPRK